MIIQSYEFLASVLRSMKEHVVVISDKGDILYVNDAWETFNKCNDGDANVIWTNINYLSVCDQAEKGGDTFGLHAGKGIRDVIDGHLSEFNLEYPCHNPNKQQWFMMQTSPFVLENRTYCVISHRNITQRKIAEEQVRILSQTDGLTKLFNRRHFDEHLNLEWQRCSLLNAPISLAIIDLDHFKLLNDRYGHIEGDKCLQKIATLLRASTKRPGDICARYGGEEFVIVYGNTSLQQAQKLLEQLIIKIHNLAIPNENSPTAPFVTASIGLSTMIPHQNNSIVQLISNADTMLYSAKKGGRNRLAYTHQQTDLSFDVPKNAREPSTPTIPNTRHEPL
jgi:diguanylate cyclase (GGDEF)-like protein